jgi:light-regulated signal transduction histidine kinase (bacteriophytochrome)
MPPERPSILTDVPGSRDTFLSLTDSGRHSRTSFATPSPTAPRGTVGRLADDRGFYLEDDGPGVPAEDRDEVFSYGYSTDNSGTGFGLAIVRTIVEAHGWDVSLADRDAGGARFEIRTAPTAAGIVDAELAA